MFRMFRRFHETCLETSETSEAFETCLLETSETFET